MKDLCPSERISKLGKSICDPTVPVQLASKKSSVVLNELSPTATMARKRISTGYENGSFTPLSSNVLHNVRVSFPITSLYALGKDTGASVTVGNELSPM